MSDFNRGGRRDFGRRDFGGGRGGDRPMYRAVCSRCGKDCEVPFRPTTGKPVFCSQCFEGRDNGRGDDRRDNRGDNRGGGTDQLQRQLTNLEAKVDRILKILSPEEKKVEPAPIKEEVQLPAVEKKVKKAAKKVAAKKK
jgi:CxxC-x17-CxxC domain-containing protein